MTSQLTRKQIILGITAIAVLIAILIFSFASTGNDSGDESAVETRPELELTPDERFGENVGGQDQVTTTTFDSSGVLKLPFDAAAKRELAALEKTGVLDTNLIYDYISPRYEAILGGDPSSPIPISELNNPENSDLPENIFLAARATAIEIVKAELTGEGRNKWPEYFSGQPQGKCTKFQSDVAGAISLPLPQSKNWIVTYVQYSANCPTPTGTALIRQQMSVYFETSNGKLIPRVLSQVPRA